MVARSSGPPPAATPGAPVPAAVSLSRVMSELSTLRSEVRAALQDFETFSAEAERQTLNTLSSRAALQQP